MRAGFVTGNNTHIHIENADLFMYFVETNLTCLATSLINATPGSKEGKTREPYLRTSGSGLIFNVTSVTTPNRPGRIKEIDG